MRLRAWPGACGTAHPAFSGVRPLARDVHAVNFPGVLRNLRDGPSGRFDSDRPDGIVAPMDRAGPPSVRDRMLDAAEAVVVRQGIANLTLDAVAAEAGMSKGGLLHHYPSKDKLIEGMVARCAENWRSCVTSAYDEVPPGPGRMARALLNQLADSPAWSEQCQRSSSAVFAALAQNPALIQPMRQVYAELRGRLTSDGLAPGVGETIVAAMDGLWLCRVLGLAPVDADLMGLIHKTLEPLVQRTKVPSPGARKPSVRRAKRRPAGRTASQGDKK